jgi:periplasmic protein TonB
MTINMNILGRSEGLEEIVFEKRNKEYGAYALRKSIDSTVNTSTLVTLSLACIISLLLLKFGQKTELQPDPVSTAVIFDASLVLPDDALVVKLPESMPVPKSISQPAMNNLWQVVDDPKPIPLEIPAGIMDPDVKNPPLNVQYIPMVTDQKEFGQSKQDYIIIAEEMPSFKNGNLEDFRKWVNKHLAYPEDASETDVQGKVIVAFIIGTSGQIEDITILRGVHESLNNEVVRVLKLSPRWTPGKQGGTPVRVRYTMPINFQING